MQLTLFTLPKAFREPFTTIQDNALRSWLQLEPRPDILLFGKDEGVAEAAARYGLRHLPEMLSNAFGTPLVNELFRSATRETRTPYQGYINADILLDPSWPKLIDRILQWQPKAMVVSRRWDFQLDHPLEFNVPADYAALAARVRREGELYTPLGMDVFVFPTGTFDDMPPFSIGWPGAKYDNWLIWRARELGLPIIDATDALTTIHQNHPYGSPNPRKAMEHWISLDLLGGFGCCYDIRDATHVIDAAGVISRRRRSLEDRKRELIRFAKRLRYRLRRARGFSYTAANAT